jgi:DNA-binding beta-propeller fold protein YncE
MTIRARTLIAVLSLALAGALAPAGAAAEKAALVLEKTIPLANVTGRIDHLAVDLARRRLAVAELGNNTVDILDLADGRLLHRITGLQEPQGVAFVRSADAFAVASAGDGTVQFFKAGNFAPTGQLDLGDDADNIRVNRRTGDLIVGYGEGGLAIIDTVRRAKRADIPLPAHPEGFQIAADGRRVFVNLPDAGQIVSVDLLSGKPVAAWADGQLKSNFPMAIDGAGKTLAIVFRGPPRLVLRAAGTGDVIAGIETCGDADDVFFDDKRRRLYVSCGEGAVDVVERGTDGLQHLGPAKTSTGARTALFVPELDRLFVAARGASDDEEATLLVFRPQP